MEGRELDSSLLFLLNSGYCAAETPWFGDYHTIFCLLLWISGLDVTKRDHQAAQ